MGAIGTLCPRSVYLEGGQVKAMGSTRDVLAAYLSDNLRNRYSESEKLDQLRLAGMGQKVRFSSVRLLGRDGYNLGFGEPLIYSLRVNSDAKIDGASIGSSIFDQSGSCVGTLFTRETFSVAPGEALTMRLVVPNIDLAPGTYYAGFSIGHGGSDGQRHDLDIVIGTPWFEVVAGSRNGNTIANWHQNWGNIVISQAKLHVEHAHMDP
jgi:hypothetical protein